MSLPTVIQEAVDNLWTLDSVEPEYIDILTDAEQDAVEPIEKAGYERLGVGTDRIVFALGDSTVVKLARPPHGSHDGYQANTAEIANWNNASEDQREVLAPIHGGDADGRWLIMERATAIRGYEHEIRDSFKERCRACGISLNRDSLRWNVGRINSRQQDCLIDYAQLRL